MMWRSLHPPPSATGIATVSDQILLQLQELDYKMDSMNRKVQKTEAALSQGSPQTSAAFCTSQNASLNDAVFVLYIYILYLTVLVRKAMLQRRLCNMDN